jgi:hypothetical protein
MRNLLLIGFIFLAFSSFAQKEIELKKKFFGAYKGVIPAYKMDTGKSVVEVGAAEIMIHISEKEIEINIGKNALHGVYEVMFEASEYFLLDAKIEGQIANERILVYKRGKKLSRDGMFPQPIAELRKI